MSKEYLLKYKLLQTNMVLQQHRHAKRYLRHLQAQLYLA